MEAREKYFVEKYRRNNKYKIKSGQILVLFFALGISTGGFVAVFEFHFLPSLVTTFKQKCQAIIVSCSKTAQTKLLLAIAKLQQFASSWKIAMAEDVRILCWIMTTAPNHRTKAIHVKNTWGKHCHTLLFFSDAPDLDLPAVDLNVGEGRQFLWAKTAGAFEYVHQNYYEDYDWVLKADDDTFLFVENAQKRVQSLDWTEPYYLGFQLKLDNNDTANSTSYPSGGAGYILSKKSVDLLVELLQNNSWGLLDTFCPNSTNNGSEDFNLGCYLETMEAKCVDTRDKNGRETFMPLGPRWSMFPAATIFTDQWWLFTDSYWPTTRTGHETFSSQYVSYHYINSSLMYQMYFLIYAMGHVQSVEHMTRIQQNTSIWDLQPPPKVNYSGIQR